MSGFNPIAILSNPEFAKMLWKGLQMTFVVAVGSWLLAMSLAVVLLVLRLTGARIAEAFVAAYVSYHRNVPTLVQLMLWYFGISSLLPKVVQGGLNAWGGEVLFAVIGLGLCQAAYFSEDLRSGCAPSRSDRRKPPGLWAMVTSARSAIS